MPDGNGARDALAMWERTAEGGSGARPGDTRPGEVAAGIDGFLLKHGYLIHDRDPLLRGGLPALLRSAGVEPVKLPPHSPNLNAYAERFVRSIKEECLSKIVPLGERHLRHAIEQYAVHYHLERNHQGLGNRLIDGEAESKPVDRVDCRERLGGLLRSYHRAA